MPLAAATIAEGPLALDGIFTANGFSINSLSAYPQARLRRISGLRGKELSNLSVANTGRIGETPLPSIMRGKTVTFEGDLRALNLPSLRTFETAMLGAFQQDDVYQFTIAPPTARGGVSHLFTARVLSLVIDDEQLYGPSRTPSPHQRPFVMTLYQFDPRYFADSQQTVTGKAAGTTHTFTNAGNAPAEPSFVIPGSATLDQVDVRNQTTNKKLLFTGLVGLVPAGSSLTIDFANREVYNAAGTDLSGRMDVVQSTWWDEGEPGIVPGTNVIWGGGTGVSTWDMSFMPANW